MSSAYNLMNRFVASGRSFMNIRKSIGPSIDPWGILYSMSSAIDLMVSISTNLLRCFKKDASSSRAFP